VAAKVQRHHAVPRSYFGVHDERGIERSPFLNINVERRDPLLCAVVASFESQSNLVYNSRSERVVALLGSADEAWQKILVNRSNP